MLKRQGQEHFAARLPKRPWFRPGEVAMAIGMSERFVHKLLESGALPAHKHNAATGANVRWRISREAVVSYLLSSADYAPEDQLSALLFVIRRLASSELEILQREIARIRNDE